MSEVIGSWKIIEIRLPAQLAQLVGLELEEVGRLEQDLAAHDVAGRLREEAQDRERRDALAAARLADDPDRLVGREVEGHAR